MVIGGRADEGLTVYDCGQWGKEAHAWPQLPLRKLSRQLSKMYCSNAPKSQRPALTTLGKLSLLFYCGDLTSVSVHSSSARKTATCHSPKGWRQGEREFKDLCNLYTVVSMGCNMPAGGRLMRSKQSKRKNSFIRMQSHFLNNGWAGNINTINTDWQVVARKIMNFDILSIRYIRNKKKHSESTALKVKSFMEVPCKQTKVMFAFSVCFYRCIMGILEL